MHLGLIIESNDAERIWNAFRLANEALEAEHDVEAFLLGEGVEAAEVESATCNPRGVLRRFVRDGGTLLACGTCLDTRDMEPTDLRPRGSMADLLAIVERADEVLTIG